MKGLLYTISTALLIAGISSCGSEEQQPKTEENLPKAGIMEKEWGTTDGKQVYLYTLTNPKGVEVKITNYGGIVTSWVTPDKKGNKSSIVVGFDSLAPYLQSPPYFGSLVGRYGNRIAKAKFSIDGKSYQLAANNGKNSLHGGLKGFDKVVWDGSIPDTSSASLLLHYTSADGEEGFPGKLDVTVKYTLTDDNELVIDYSATTDKPTPVNLTNHSYFNLTGDVNNTILDHVLMIDADNYTPVDGDLIPTGKIVPVANTPFDFTKGFRIGARIDSVPGGYDHNFVLNKKDTSLKLVAALADSLSGRQLEVYTTEPGLQFYTGNFLDGKFTNHDGKPVKKNTALCLETQHFPDSPNQPSFPSTILKPGEKYHTVTKYKVVVE